MNTLGVGVMLAVDSVTTSTDFPILKKLNNRYIQRFLKMFSEFEIQMQTEVRLVPM